VPISQLAVCGLRDFKRLPDVHLKAVSKSDRRSTVLDLTYIGWPSSLSRRQPANSDSAEGMIVRFLLDRFEGSLAAKLNRKRLSGGIRSQ